MIAFLAEFQGDVMFRKESQGLMSLTSFVFPLTPGKESLRMVSLEDNYIDSLDIFSALFGLVELYLSNNLVEELRSVRLTHPR